MNKCVLALLLTGAMAVSFTACGSTEATESQAEEAVITSDVYVSENVKCTLNAVGDKAITVTTADGDQFTLNLGDDVVYSFTAPEMPSGDTGDGSDNQSGQAPDMQGGQNAPSGTGDSAQTPPEKPDGEAGNGSAPEMPSGDNAPAGNPGDGSTPPEMADGQNAPSGTGDSAQTPPEKPDGGAGNGSAPEMTNGDNAQAGNPGDGSTPPEMPSGDNAPSGNPQDGSNHGGEMTEQANQEAGFESLAAGQTVTLTFDENGEVSAVAIQMSFDNMSQQGGPGMGQPGGSNMGGPGGGSSAPTEYTALNTYSEDMSLSSETVTSTGDDENAILVQSGNVTMDNMTISRDSDSSTGGDNSSFYGVGAAVLVTDGTATISNSTITTDAKGGAGAFAYGDGTIYISGSNITTTQDTSGGIHVAGGGTLYAWDLSVETNGESSAAIRSDRGSGTMVVDGGSYTSNGTGSPAIYSTADITVNNANLTANGSEAICIEGLNTIRLYDCNLTGNMPDNDQNDCTWNVILYQSMSGDSEQGNSTFEMVGGTLTAKNGGMFYTTNTESTFVLQNVQITNAENAAFLLKCTGNSNARGWGASGSNGADCTFTAIEQTLQGDVIWDSISNLDMYLTENSTLTGAFVDDESNAGQGGDGTATLTIDEGSTWVVTGNSTLTTLNNAGMIVDTNGNSVTIQGTDGTVYVQGSSDVTVTVSAYNTTADLGGASQAHSFSDYEVSKA